MMNIQKNKDELKKLFLIVCEDIKALNPIAMDISGSCDFTDYFFICSGNSLPHIKAIAREIEKQIYQRYKEKPAFSSGRAGDEWIVLDYIDYIVHIFSKDLRNYYSLEDFWQRKSKDEN